MELKRAGSQPKSLAGRFVEWQEHVSEEDYLAGPVQR